MSNIMMLAVAVGATFAVLHLIYSLIMYLMPNQFINFVATIHHVAEGPRFNTKVTFSHVVTGTIIHFAFGFAIILLAGSIYEFLFDMHGMR